MKHLLVFFAAAGACTSLPSKTTEPATELEGEGDDDEDDDERLALETTVDAEDGLKILITVRVEPDQRTVSFDLDDDTVEAFWDGREDKGCNCRHFLSEGFAVTVTFPSAARDGQAVVERR